MKTDKVKGIKSIDLVYKFENTYQEFEGYLKKKDLEKDIKVYIKLDNDNLELGNTYKLELCKISNNKKEVIKESKIVIKQLSNSCIVSTSLKAFEDGLYHYNVIDKDGNILTCKFRIGKKKMKTLYFLVPVVTISLTLFLLTRLDINFSLNNSGTDTIEEGNGPLEASGGTNITAVDLKNKTREEKQALLNQKAKENNTTLNMLSTSTLIANKDGVISEVTIKNPEVSSYDLTVLNDFYKSKRAYSIDGESGKTISEVFSIYDIKYYYDRIEDKEYIKFNVIFNNVDTADKFKITLYNEDENELYETNIIDFEGSSIDIVLKDKLTDEPAIYSLKLYDDKEKEIYNIYHTLKIIENYKNEIPCQFILLDSEGNNLFVSPMTTPGDILNSMTLNKTLPIGTYDVVLRYSFYDKDGKCFVSHDKPLKLKVV